MCVVFSLPYLFTCVHPHVFECVFGVSTTSYSANVYDLHAIMIQSHTDAQITLDSMANFATATEHKAMIQTMVTYFERYVCMYDVDLRG